MDKLSDGDVLNWSLNVEFFTSAQKEKGADGVVKKPIRTKRSCGKLPLKFFQRR